MKYAVTLRAWLLGSQSAGLEREGQRWRRRRIGPKRAGGRHRNVKVCDTRRRQPRPTNAANDRLPCHNRCAWCDETHAEVSHENTVADVADDDVFPKECVPVRDDDSTINGCQHAASLRSPALDTSPVLRVQVHTDMSC
jgi:hypothetical protein